MVKVWSANNGSTNDLDVDYSYRDDYSLSENSLQQIYFPSADFTNRTYADTTRNITSRKVHSNNALLRHYNFLAGATVQTAKLNRDEQYPEPTRFDKRFNAVLPSFSLISRVGITQSTLIYYQAMTQLPYVEQLRPQIDNTNPYMLVGGNPNLKQSYRHILMLTHQRLFGKQANTLEVKINLNYTGNMIAPKRIFIAQWGSLPN